MYNKLKTLFLLGALSLTISCNNETDETTQSKETLEIVSKKILDDSIKDFEVDAKASNLDPEIKNWKEAVDKQDFVSAEKHQSAIDKTLNELYDKYKKEKVEEYIQILHEIEMEGLGTHDGDPCTRNRNGTIYLGACSFWQKVSLFMSFRCSGLPRDTPAQIESYHDCLQSNICNTCK